MLFAARIALAWLLLVGLAHADGTVGVGADGLTFAVTNGIGKKGSGGGGPTNSLAFTGPSSGTVEVASTNFTVSIGSGSFNGSQTVTIADGSKGGTLTPSVGSPGTSTVTVTPTNGATSFTLTYTPVVVATITLTVTNAQSWTNPSPLSYASSTCSQYTTLAGKLDGGQNVAATTALICGLVADGIWAKVTMFHNYASNSTANAALNWVSTSFNATLSGATHPTFSTNNGYVGNGTTGYIGTGFTPSTSGGATLNSTAIGFCDLSTNASTTVIHMGASDSINADLLAARQGTPAFLSRLNNGVGTTNSDTLVSANAMWSASRTGSANYTTYKNGSALSTQTTASTSLITVPLSVLAFNNNNTVQSFSADTFAMAFISSGLTGTDISNLYTRYHTYELAVGTTNPC